MTLRFFAATLILCFTPLLAQVQTPPPAATSTQTAQTPSPSTQPPASTQPATPAAPAQPDYPEPRTFTVGIFYWLTGPGTTPSLQDGHTAIDYGILNDLGRAHRSPGFDLSYPVTRTGTLHLEVFETKGDANQIAPAPAIILTATVNPGDYLATQYQVRGAKLYLDDLLYPHKFPVSRLRFKSLWGIEYLGVNAAIDEPLYDFNNPSQTEFPDSHTFNIIYPSFGLAAEYALTGHILFRIDASGFGFIRRSDFWDGNATLSWRINHFEIVAGAKALHFKTSPNNPEFVIGTFAGAFAGVAWHL